MAFDLSVKQVPTAFIKLPNGVEITVDRLVNELEFLDGSTGVEFKRFSETDLGIYQFIMNELCPVCSVANWENSIRVYFEEDISAPLDELITRLRKEEESISESFQTLQITP